MPPFHAQSVDHALETLNSNRAGLSGADAAQRLVRYGQNRFPEPAGKTLARVLLHQFKSPFIYLLLCAGAVSLAIGHSTDAVFIVSVLVLNASIGTVQEWRAEKRARGLKELVVGSVSVWRDGLLKRLPKERLVPGDIVQFESGERISADIRLIAASNLRLDESLLTGESVPIQKWHEPPDSLDAALAERRTMLHAGTMVQTGRAVGIVVATGRQTALGQLAASLELPDLEPPLVRRMARFTNQLGVAMIFVIVLIALLEAARGASLTEILLLSIALAVSAIPEGLPVAMTVALSIAMHRMGLRNVVVRHLPAVEGLGACTLIATDKTGTLTLNSLTIERAWLPGPGEVAPEDHRVASMLIAGALASEAPAGSADSLSGDAVDLAFIRAARSALSEPGTALLAGRIPYEPEKRFAAVFHQDKNGFFATVKGAPETVVALCAPTHYEALSAADRMSAAGYRVIAVASGPVAHGAEHALTGLRLLGYAGLIDPLRPEAKQAVQAALGAGLRVVMITGDHPLTALAIARQLGLAKESRDVITGRELRALPATAFDQSTAHASVFARTEPLQKLAIIESLQRQGQVVAVTGDGINDAPALHAADIGVAMGRAGTDVARDAADLIITDDNFASIVAGIEEGRVAYDNLRKVILLLISTGAAEILVMLLATASGLPPPLTAVQLLWLNLITNGLQDVALAFEKPEPDILKRRPRPAKAGILDRSMIEQVAVGGCAIGLSAFAAYYIMLANGLTHATAQGAVLWLLVWCENAHAFNCRSETRSVLKIPFANNPFLVLAVVGAQILQLLAFAIPPIRDMLSLEGITPLQALSLAIAGLLILGVMEFYKLVRLKLPFHAGGR